MAGVTEEDTKTLLEKDPQGLFWGIQTQPWQLFDLNLGLGCSGPAGPKEHLGGLGFLLLHPDGSQTMSCGLSIQITALG